MTQIIFGGLYIEYTAVNSAWPNFSALRPRARTEPRTTRSVTANERMWNVKVGSVPWQSAEWSGGQILIWQGRSYSHLHWLITESGQMEWDAKFAKSLQYITRSWDISLGVVTRLRAEKAKNSLFDSRQGKQIFLFSISVHKGCSHYRYLDICLPTFL